MRKLLDNLKLHSKILLLLLICLLLHPKDANANFAYVANAGTGSTGTVSVIDTSTNTVTATINVGTFPEAIAITPSVSVLDLQAQQIKNDFGVVYTLVNQLQWQANPSAGFIAGYFVFRNGVLVATLSPFTFHYNDRNSL